MKTLLSAVQACLEQAGLWKAQSRLLCAVSGGADSVALLNSLCLLREEGGFSLYASHVQHGLRGADSEADERFVRELCQAWDVPLDVRRAGLEGTMDTPGMETQARNARRRLFSQQMREWKTDALLLAHHRDDQTETVLMHLLRGAGADGLRGMQCVQPFANGLLLRPFLGLPKQALTDALAARGIPHREDGSNQEAVTPRNALRLSILPQMEALFPGSGAHIAQAAAVMEVDEAYLQSEAAKLYRVHCVPPVFALERAPLNGAPEALARRVVRRFWREGCAAAGLETAERNLSCADTLALCALLTAAAGTVHNLPCGLMAAAGAQHVHLLHQSGEPLCAAEKTNIPVQTGEATYALSHAVITQAPASRLPAGNHEAVLSPEWLARAPVFRTPLPSDRIHPFGAPGSKPLRRFLTDRKIDPCLRPALPVLAVEDDILWIPSICTAEALRLRRVEDGSVHLCLQGGLFETNKE